jgi:hypothetical protein
MDIQIPAHIQDIINKGLYKPHITKWTLWFHNINDDKWNLKDYINICDIGSIEEYIYTMREISDITKGMFFLMKDDIHPIWESDDNINGGYWSFRVSKSLSNDTWKYLTTALVTNTLTTNEQDISYINGICVSPKYNNCIFKILNNDSHFNNVQMLKNNIPNIDISQPIYRAHKESNYLKL